MAILYDRTGNEVWCEDDEVEAKLAETWTVHHRKEPRYFEENPDTRTEEEKATQGAERAKRRAKKKTEQRVMAGVLEAKDFQTEVAAETRRVKAELLASDPERPDHAKLVAIGRKM